MRAALRALQRVDFQMGRLLHLLFARRLYRLLGFPTAARYAEERLGLSARKARALVALDRCSAALPALAAAYRQGEVSWLRALSLLPVVDEGSTQPRHRDPIFARDGWRCAVPACTSRRNLHDHHLLFRSRGGGNARDNRITVCAWHHLRGIHQGRVRAWGTAPDAVTWELGTRPGQPPLLTLQGDRYMGGSDHMT